MKTRFTVAAIGFACSLAAFGIDFLPVPGSQKGQVTFVNKQSRLPEGEIQAVCVVIEKATKCKTVLGTKEGAGAQVVIEVLDDATSPVMAAYPEDYRASVNVGRLDKNLKGRALDKFFTARCRKELLRAFCFACGAGGSQYPNNIMAIGDVTDLDLCEEFIPGDTVLTCVMRLAKIGIKPTKFVSYAKACREGWAPAPTNEVQKIIWDKVQADKERGPSNPITIPPPVKK